MTARSVYCATARLSPRASERLFHDRPRIPDLLLVAPVKDKRQLPMSDPHQASWGIDTLGATTNGSDQVIIGKGGDTGGGIRWWLMVDSGGTRFELDDDNNTRDPRGPQDDDDGVWHHAVGVADGELYYPVC